jgi:hypothetical protein
VEDGVELLAESQIVGPSGEVLAKAMTAGDEIVDLACDLDLAQRYRNTLFDFERYRMVEHYGLITERRDSIPPSPLNRPNRPNPSNPPTGGAP